MSSVRPDTRAHGSWEWMKGAAALSDGNYRKNSDFSQYSSRLFLETESRRPVSHKALSPRVHARSARLGDIPALSRVSMLTHTGVRAPTVTVYRARLPSFEKSADPSDAFANAPNRSLPFAATCPQLESAFPGISRARGICL